jgi:hypothetical protein
MPFHAGGTFEVTRSPEPPYDAAPGATLSRVSLSKQFHGDLEAASEVRMLSAISDVKGSAGYVAIERVIGKLRGRAGSFVLQHSGTLKRGQAELSVTVVPDSGTAELKGLAGNMTIEVVNNRHSYAFDYTFDDPG